MTSAIEFLRQRKTAYQLKFGSFDKSSGGEPADIVREDLARFCRANASTWSDDARHHARLEGRREVWLRIQQHLELEPEELAKLYGAVDLGQRSSASQDEDPWQPDEPT